MNDANFLIVLTTFVMFGLTREPSLESVDGMSLSPYFLQNNGNSLALLPELGDTIPILKNLCTEIVSDLKEKYVNLIISKRRVPTKSALQLSPGSAC